MIDAPVLDADHDLPRPLLPAAMQFAGTAMRSSRPLTVDGHFVGVVICRPGDWTFFATHPSTVDLSGATFRTQAEAAAAARHGWLRNRRRRAAA